MNYIENSFHFYETTESFEVHRKQGLIHPDSICFLKETAQIYTQESFFGICKERFERLEQLVLAHDAKIKNIMGIEGPSVNDGIVNNLADLVNFLDGFTDRDNLKEVIDGVRNNLEKQIESVSKELSDRVTALEDNINNDTENLQNTLNIINNKLDTVDIRLDNHDTALSAINTSLASHIREYNVLKTNYDNFKAYTESKFIAVDSSISSINTSITSLQRQFTELDEKFDDVENEVSSVESMLEDARKLVKEIEDRFGETLAAIEQFKRDIHNEIDDLKDLIGAPNGIAPLDSDAKVPSAYLPSYVDDVLEYATKAAFPVRGEEGKIYVALDDNLTYRWSGSTYVEISKSLGLGETSTTAYPGNKGKEVTDALKAHKLDYGNPHRVTKAQVGLDKVDNTRDIDKPISTAVQEALDNKVQIEPGKSLIDSEEAAKVIASNKKVEEFEESLQYEVDRATSAEAVISGALAQHKSDNSNPHGVTKTQVGLSNVDNTSDIDKPVSTAQQIAINAVSSDITAHINDKNNPHEVTKTQVGLSNVDNTSDLDKPVSTATQAALDTLTDALDQTLGESAKNLNDHITDYNNPHKVTKAQVGLGNVDNTADIDKPVSTAVQNLVNTTKSDLESKINTGGSSLNSHVLDKSNPHEVTKAQVGLGNVDNTSDADKPVSAAQAEAIQEVQDDLDSHKSNVSNPHSVTKAQVGLGNVDNESKATMFTSPVFTGIPTAPTPASTVDNTQIATTAFVKSVINKQIAGNDAMIFKGVINSNSDLPATHEVGWTYKVGTIGTYAGESCEVGDMIMCITDGTVADNTHWSIIQTNIDGAVTGPASSLSGNIPVFDGSTGKIIKDSGSSLSNIYTKSVADNTFIKKGTDTIDNSSLTFNTYDVRSNPIINIKNTGTSMYGQGIALYRNNGFIGSLNIDYNKKNLMWKTYPILDGSNYADTLDSIYVGINSTQEIKGTKTFTNYVSINAPLTDTPLRINSKAGGGCYFKMLSGNTEFGSYGATESGPVWRRSGNEYSFLLSNNYTSTLDNTYVKRSGDTIPGYLILGSGSNYTLGLDGGASYSKIRSTYISSGETNDLHLYSDRTEFSKRIEAPGIITKEFLTVKKKSATESTKINLESYRTWSIIANYSPDSLLIESPSLSNPIIAKLASDGTLTVSKIVKKDGTSTQFLKADGSTSTLSNASSSDAGLMSAEDKVNLDFLFGVNKVTSVSNIPVNKRLVVASISSSATLSIASTPDAGKEIHIIVKNTGSSKITITLNSGLLSSFQDTSFDIESGAFGEVNIISDGTNVYTRWA